MKDTILSMIDTNCPFRGSLHWYDCTDSTNTQAKLLAQQGAPHGTMVIAGMQTQGRGRMGRSFVSPESGLYFSVILRPGLPAAELMHLTCCAAVTACDAVQTLIGIRPDIKWINDLQFAGKKLGGILTELAIDPATGMADYAIIGIGINCLQVPQAVAEIATSLSQIAEKPISPAPMAAALANAFGSLDLSQKISMMERYRGDCVTLGKQVQVVGKPIQGTATQITDDGALVITLADGTSLELSSGEVSVRNI